MPYFELFGFRRGLRVVGEGGHQLGTSEVSGEGRNGRGSKWYRLLSRNVILHLLSFAYQILEYHLVRHLDALTQCLLNY